MPDLIAAVLAIPQWLWGAVVGGLLSLLAKSILERKRWSRERREKLAEVQRKAIAAALEWISPMRNAHTTASSVLSGVRRGDLNIDEIWERWPELMSTLKEMDLSGELQAVLPEGTYPRGIALLNSFDEVRTSGIRECSEAGLRNTPSLGLKESGDLLDKIEIEIDRLEEDLRTSYSAS